MSNVLLQYRRPNIHESAGYGPGCCKKYRLLQGLVSCWGPPECPRRAACERSAACCRAQDHPEAPGEHQEVHGPAGAGLHRNSCLVLGFEWVPQSPNWFAKCSSGASRALARLGQAWQTQCGLPSPAVSGSRAHRCIAPHWARTRAAACRSQNVDCSSYRPLSRPPSARLWPCIPKPGAQPGTLAAPPSNPLFTASQACAWVGGRKELQLCWPH